MLNFVANRPEHRKNLMCYNVPRMQVILLKDHHPLGRKGDVVNVSDGHAFNFLFPQHLAVEATPRALEEAVAAKEAGKRRTQRVSDKARDAAAKLDGFELILAEKTNDAGHLYAAVNTKEVAKALKKEGYDVKAAQIKMKPMKETGEADVLVTFPGGFEAQIKIIIEAA